MFFFNRFCSLNGSLISNLLKSLLNTCRKLIFIFLRHVRKLSVTQLLNLKCRSCNEAFGLRQILPPPLHRPPWRDEKRSIIAINFGAKLKQQVEAWKNRVTLVIDGEYDDLSSRQSDEYFTWYNHITRLHVGRPSQGSNEARSIGCSIRSIGPVSGS